MNVVGFWLQPAEGLLGIENLTPMQLPWSGSSKQAQRLGFTLDEIRDLLQLRKANGQARPSVRAAAISKLSDIEARLQQLVAMRDALRTLVDQCDCSDQAICPIIESLSGGEGTRGR